MTNLIEKWRTEAASKEAQYPGVPTVSVKAKVLRGCASDLEQAWPTHASELARLRDRAQMAEGFINDRHNASAAGIETPSPLLGAAIALSRLWNDEATHAHSLKVMERCRWAGERVMALAALHDLMDGDQERDDVKRDAVGAILGGKAEWAVVVFSRGPHGASRGSRHKWFLYEVATLFDSADWRQTHKEIAIVATFDRLENAQRCVADGHSLLKAYRREHPSLREALTADPELMAMEPYAAAWDWMDEHLGGE